MTLSDNELWQAFKQGYRVSFNNLFRKYYPVLFQYGNKLCPDVDLLEDCIQELFIDLWQGRSHGEVRSVKAYLLKALKFKIYKQYRDTEKKQASQISDDLAFVISHETFLINRQEDQQRTEKV